MADGDPVRPDWKVRVITSHAKRTVSLGPRNASFSLLTGAEVEPDPKLKLRENIDLLQRLVIQRVDAVCDAVEASVNAKEGENADVQ